MDKEKTSIEKLANMNLEGLLLPEPAPASLWWLWVLIGLLLLLVFWAWRKNYHSPKTTALRTLKQLQNGINDSDAHEAKKQIAQSLRHGFNVTRLDAVMPDNLKWREYLKTLETALYSKQKNESRTLSLLITKAQTWLRNS